MLPADYRVLYDVSTQGFVDTWSFPLKGLGIVAVTIIIFSLRNFLFESRPSVFRRWFPILIMAFAVFWTLNASFEAYFQHQGLVRALHKAGVVEGEVYDFVPMLPGGHSAEHFCVKSNCFSYSEFVVTGAFNNTLPYGGLVRNGQIMRVSYWGNQILKLEVRN